MFFSSPLFPNPVLEGSRRQSMLSRPVSAQQGVWTIVGARCALPCLRHVIISYSVTYFLNPRGSCFLHDPLPWGDEMLVRYVEWRPQVHCQAWRVRAHCLARHVIDPFQAIELVVSVLEWLPG